MSLSPHSTFCTTAPSFLFFRPIAVFSLLVSTSKARHHFSLFCTLSRQVFLNFLCHTPLILPVVSGFFDSFPSFLLVCVFAPFTQLYIHPSSFCSQFFHFFTEIPVSLIVFLSLSFFSVFFSLFCLQTLPLSFPLSLSSYSSHTLPAVSLSLLKYFSCTFCTSSCSFHPQSSAPYINIPSIML
jgi:hypothetical protein